MVVSSISPWKLKLDEEKSNPCRFGSAENGFGPEFLHSLLRQLSKNSVTNMYDC